MTIYLDEKKNYSFFPQRYKEITQQLDLPSVCGQFATVRFYRGVVDLSLTAASKRDPQGFALHYYRNHEPQEDSQGKYAYNIRWGESHLDK